MPDLSYSCCWGKPTGKQISWGSPRGVRMKHDAAQAAEEPQDYFSLDTTFNEMVVNEA